MRLSPTRSTTRLGLENGLYELKASRCVPKTLLPVEKVSCNPEVTVGSSLREPQTAKIGPLRCVQACQSTASNKSLRDFSTLVHAPAGHHCKMKMAWSPATLRQAGAERPKVGLRVVLRARSTL